MAAIFCAILCGFIKIVSYINGCNILWVYQDCMSGVSRLCVKRRNTITCTSLFYQVEKGKANPIRHLSCWGITQGDHPKPMVLFIVVGWPVPFSTN